MAGFVGARKYLSMVDTEGIVEGRGHLQEASTVASGQRMSQDETGGLKCLAAASTPLWQELVKGKRRPLASLHLLNMVILLCW